MNMKRDEVFPSKYLKAADLGGKRVTVTIKDAPLELLKNHPAKSTARSFCTSPARKKACR
jgi:hypothetical protein